MLTSKRRLPAVQELDLGLSPEERALLSDSDVKALLSYAGRFDNGVSESERRTATRLLSWLGPTPPPLGAIVYLAMRPFAWVLTGFWWLVLTARAFAASEQEEAEELRRARAAWRVRARVVRQFGPTSRFVRFHWLQALMLGFLVVVPPLLTCGLALILTIPYAVWADRVRRGAAQGEWTRLPLVGWVAALFIGPRRRHREVIAQRLGRPLPPPEPTEPIAGSELVASH